MTGFGLTIGFHRLLTHRNFQTYPAVKIILLILGSMGVAGPPIASAATHIKHHSRPDHEAILTLPWRGYFTRMSAGFSRTDFLMPCARRREVGVASGALHSASLFDWQRWRSRTCGDAVSRNVR
jgi:hypothetical protein